MHVNALGLLEEREKESQTKEKEKKIVKQIFSLFQPFCMQI